MTRGDPKPGVKRRGFQTDPLPDTGATVVEPNTEIAIGPQRPSQFFCGKCNKVLFEDASLSAFRESLKPPRGAFYTKCDRCSSPLHIPDVPQPHPSFREPDNRAIKIWRYMDLAKFLAILQHNALFFPRASQLGDPFEGSTPKMNRALWDSVIDIRKTNPGAPFLVQFKDMTDEQIAAMAAQLSQMRRDAAETFLVNSWHMSEYESAAMWKVYTAADEAIGIQTTFGKLRRLMPDWIFIGAVNYIDYDNMMIGEGNEFNFITIKRHSFDYERELRAVVWTRSWVVANTDIRDGITPYGMWVDANLSSLLEAIYISPTSPSWFAESVLALVQKYGLSIPVLQSSLKSSPIF